MIEKGLYVQVVGVYCVIIEFLVFVGFLFLGSLMFVDVVLLMIEICFFGVCVYVGIQVDVIDIILDVVKVCSGGVVCVVNVDMFM